MPKRRPTTNRELSLIQECCEAGLTKSDTARLIGCAENTIRYWAGKTGMDFRRKYIRTAPAHIIDRIIDCPICGRETGVHLHQRGRPWNQQQIWLIRRMKAIGASGDGIAKTLGTGRTMINELLRSHRI